MDKIRYVQRGMAVYHTGSIQNSRHDQKANSSCILVKMSRLQSKKMTLNVMREKYQITYKGKSARIIAEVLVETLKARRAQNNIFHALRENSCQLSLLSPSMLPFRIERKIKTF